MTQKKIDEDGNIKNNTGTELELLKTIERSYYKANKNAQKRNTAASMKWFSKYIPKNYARVRTARLFRDRKLWADSIDPGSMYTFEYDALHKDTLPFWDRYPLVFFFDSFKSKEGKQLLLGINLHYLPPALRLVAYKALLKTRNEKRYRSSTKLKLSWQVLKGLSASKYFEHSVKMYRVDHLASKFVKVPPSSWEMFLFLPTARFVGSKSKAWNV
jgi:hypothetical protein